MSLVRAFLLLVALLGAVVWAQPANTPTASANTRVAGWLARAHEAARGRGYAGTFVVWDGLELSSSRIWHVCDGAQQFERVDSLTGVPRVTLRRNEQVLTLWPQSKTAVREQRDTLSLFPGLLKVENLAIDDYYAIRNVGTERVAGLTADVFLIQAKDQLRFGYRVWSERSTGLVVKLQTLDVNGRTLEQSAFSELQLDAVVDTSALQQTLADAPGYRVHTPAIVKTTALAQGWVLSRPVAGFQPVSCNLRPATLSTPAAPTMQWIFSDGLATVSLFAQTFDARQHGEHKWPARGATHAISRRLGAWWVSAVGEVPQSTLDDFVRGLERVP